MSEFGEFNLPRVTRGHKPCCVLNVLESFEMASFHPFPRRFFLYNILAIGCTTTAHNAAHRSSNKCAQGDAGGGASAHPRPGDLEATRAVDHHLGHAHSLTETDGHQILMEKKSCNRKYNKKISEKKRQLKKRLPIIWRLELFRALFQGIRLRIRL